MADSFDRRATSSQPTEVEQPASERSTNVDQPTELEVLRQVIDEKCHTLDSLAAHMWEAHQRRRDRSYINKVLNGDRPMPAGFTDELPDDVQAEWHSRCAKRLGRVVVAPLSGPAAIEGFVGGLIGLLTASPALPAKADAMVKAGMPANARRRA